MRLSSLVALAVGSLSILTGIATAAAESFPTRPITLIAPFVPGGTVDTLSRQIAPYLSEILGTDVIIENRPGASGNIGAAHVAKSRPDGHTLLLTASTIIFNPLVMKAQQSVDLEKDFRPIGQVARTALAFVVSPSSGIKNVQEFIQYAKTRPQDANFGVGAFGSGGHLAMEYFNVVAGTQIPMIIYKGSAATLTDIAGGQVTGMLDPVMTTLPFVQGARLTPIAVTGESRNPLMPEVPTLAEQGIHDMDFDSWYGIWAPADVPDEVAAKLQSALTQALNHPKLNTWLLEQALSPGTTTGTAFAKLIKDEYTKYVNVVKKANFEPK